MISYFTLVPDTNSVNLNGFNFSSCDKLLLILFILFKLQRGNALQLTVDTHMLTIDSQIQVNQKMYDQGRNITPFAFH